MPDDIGVLIVGLVIICFIIGFFIVGILLLMDGYTIIGGLLIFCALIWLICLGSLPGPNRGYW